jgi:hypothetical protein
MVVIYPQTHIEKQPMKRYVRMANMYYSVTVQILQHPPDGIEDSHLRGTWEVLISVCEERMVGLHI